MQRALTDKSPGQAFYISNLAEHIVDLNNGTSKQEPAGFAERAVRKGELYVSSAVLEIPNG